MSESLAPPVELSAAKTGGHLPRPRVPTSIIVTLLGAVLTVWLAPALTRQWDDRQHARDLKAALAADMVSSVSQTIGEGAPLTDGQGQFDAVLGRWLEAALKVGVNGKAYFDPPIVHRWTGLVQDVTYFLIVCRDIADTREEALRRGRPNDPAAIEYRHQRIRDDLKLLAPTTRQADSAARLLASPEQTTSRLGMDEVKSWMLAKVQVATDEVLAAHPNGFSTTRGDLLDDLLP